MKNQLVLLEDECARLKNLCTQFAKVSRVHDIFLLDKDGQIIVNEGESKHIDVTALASLVAGNVAAIGGLAHLIDEDEFPVQFHQGSRESIHISLVGERLILMLIFDQRSSLGLVQLKLKKIHREILDLIEQIDFKSNERSPSVFSEITDEDIDDFFSDH